MSDFMAIAPSLSKPERDGHDLPDQIPGGPGGIMKCPICGDNTPDAWKGFQAVVPQDLGVAGVKIAHELAAVGESGTLKGLAGEVYFDWMYCAAEGCGTLVVRAHHNERQITGGGIAYVPDATVTWTVYPRHTSARRPDPLVPPDLALDYREASAILPISPRMSAVLSRRIVAELLARYADQEQYRLTEQIDGFVADTSRPSDLRKNIHPLREIADFGAHTQRNDREEIVNATPEQAEWTLSIVERLFDYFIVTPENDRLMREQTERMMEEAGRNPLPPLPDEEES